MEGLNRESIGFVPFISRRRINSIRFSLLHNLPEKNYGGDLRPAMNENFDQLLDDQTDMAIYRHVRKQLLPSAIGSQQILNPGSIVVCPISTGAAPKPCIWYALVDVEEDGVTSLQFHQGIL